MTTPIRQTVDTYTGGRFRWNTTVNYLGQIVPARETTKDLIWLHPARVQPRLLERLNSDSEYAASVTLGNARPMP